MNRSDFSNHNAEIQEYGVHEYYLNNVDVLSTVRSRDTNKDNVHNNGHREKTCRNYRRELPH